MNADLPCNEGVIDDKIAMIAMPENMCFSGTNQKPERQ